MKTNSIYEGSQPFQMGMSLIEIADCVKMWDIKDYATYNSLTHDKGGSKIFAPISRRIVGNSGVGNDVVEQLWKVTQPMDQAGYYALNSLLTDIAYFIVPPPPPPPGDGEG